MSGQTGSLGGKVALVTGAARGIGRAVAEELAGAGAAVVLNDVRAGADADAALAAVEARGVPAAFVQADVGRFDQVEAMRDQVLARFGGVDILVNNAGILRDGFLAQLTLEDWDEVLRVNLTGVFYCCKAFCQVLQGRGWGRIINLSSLTAQTGNLGQVNYAAAKAGVIGLTRALAREMIRSGVTVNAVAPGFVDTEILSSIPPRVKEKLFATIPAGRLASPAEVARAVAYLASPGADYVTGQVLSVNGGVFIG